MAKAIVAPNRPRRKICLFLFSSLFSLAGLLASGCVGQQDHPQFQDYPQLDEIPASQQPDLTWEQVEQEIKILAAERAQNHDRQP